MRSPQDLPVRMYVVEAERRVGDAIFNPNGYLPELHDIVLACGRRLALFLHDHRLCLRALESDRSLLVSRMQDSGLGLDGLSPGLLRSGVVAFMDAVTYTRALHGMLYALKSLLDVYANLVLRAFGQPHSSMTFKRARIDDVELPGGRLVNWLRRSSPKGFQDADRLASIFTQHSKAWIREAVLLRDQLAHYDDSRAVLDLHVVLRDCPPFVAEADVVLPRLESGEQLDDFVQKVHLGVLGLLRDTVPLLPGVDMDRIRFEDLTYDVEHVVLRIETDE